MAGWSGNGIYRELQAGPGLPPPFIHPYISRGQPYCCNDRRKERGGDLCSFSSFLGGGPAFGLMHDSIVFYFSKAHGIESRIGNPGFMGTNGDQAIRVLGSVSSGRLLFTYTLEFHEEQHNTFPPSFIGSHTALFFPIVSVQSCAQMPWACLRCSIESRAKEMRSNFLGFC